MRAVRGQHTDQWPWWPQWRDIRCWPDIPRAGLRSHSCHHACHLRPPPQALKATFLGPLICPSHTLCPIVPSGLRDPMCGEQPSFTTQDERDRQDTIQSLANVTTCYYAAGSSAYFLSQTLCDTEWQELHSLNIFRTRAAGLTSCPATVGWGCSVYGCLARLRLPPTKTSSAARSPGTRHNPPQ